MCSCPLTPNHNEYVTYGLVTSDTSTSLNIQATKACELARSCNCNAILVKISALPTTTTNTINFLTCCGTVIPAVAASSNAAVTAAQLSLNYWYEVRIIRSASGYRAVFSVL